MDSFEWELFKRTGNVESYLRMKQRDLEEEAYLAEFGELAEFDK